MCEGCPIQDECDLLSRRLRGVLAAYEVGLEEELEQLDNDITLYQTVLEHDDGDSPVDTFFREANIQLLGNTELVKKIRTERQIRLQEDVFYNQISESVEKRNCSGPVVQRNMPCLGR
jgi:hypothetical protein